MSALTKARKALAAEQVAKWLWAKIAFLSALKTCSAKRSKFSI